MKKILLLFIITLCSVFSQAQIHTINFPLLLKKVSAAAPADSVLTIGLDGIVTLVKRSELLNPLLSTKVDKTTTVNGKVLSDHITLIPWDIGLGNVANLTPAELPVSLATQQALNSISLTPGPQGIQGLQGPAGSDASVPDATTAVKGRLRLAGDLGGTADEPTVPGLSDKAPLTGAGTSGTWPIDISGHARTASNATYFGGIGYEGDLANTATAAMLYNPITSKWAAGTRADLQRLSDLNTGAVLDNTATAWGNATTAAQYDGNGTTEVNTFLMGYNIDGKWSPKSRQAVQTFLNVNEGSTLNNNIAGNSAAATTWGGRGAELNNTSNLLFAPLVIDGSDGKAKLGVNTQFKSWLGIPSEGFALQDVTNVNFTTTTPIRSLPGYYLNSPGPEGGFLWQEANAPLRFGTNNYEAIRIHANGSVGIGYVADLGYKLTINGSMFVNGAVVGNSFGLDSWVNDASIARFGHKDFNTTNNYGFLQSATGKVSIYGNGIDLDGPIKANNSATFMGDVTAANFHGKASTALKVDNGADLMSFEWAEGSTQPTWLWGSAGFTKANVYNPANLTVGNAGKWAGQTYSGTGNTSFTDVMTFNSGSYSHTSLENFKIGLGLGSAAYKNESSAWDFGSAAVAGTEVVTNNGGTWNIGIIGAAGSVPWEGVTGKPTIPTNTSQLTNGAGFLTTADVSGKEDAGNKTNNVRIDISSELRYPTAKAVASFVASEIGLLYPRVDILTSSMSSIGNYTMDQTFICNNGIDIMFPDATDWTKSTPGMKITLRGINKNASFNMYSTVFGQLETDQFGVFAGGYTEPGGANKVYSFVSDGAKWRRIR